MKSYSMMTTKEMEEYKQMYGFFYSGTVVWVDTEGHRISSDHDCTTLKELNDTIDKMKKEKNVVHINRFIRYLGGKYKRDNFPGHSKDQQEFIDFIKKAGV